MSKITNPAFAKALELEEQLAKEKELSSANTGDFKNLKEIKWFGLENQIQKVFRIVGNPYLVRENPWDIKLIFQSQIVRDDKEGYTYINWPHKIINGEYKPDPDWILKRLYDKVTEGTWEDLPNNEKNQWGGTKIKKPIHGHTEVYKRIEGNKSIKDRGFKKNFYPSKKIIINIIPRTFEDESNWSVDNNHTQLLSSNVGSKVYEKENPDTGAKESFTLYFPTTGIPEKLYKKMWSHFTQYHGDWSDVDAAVTKKSELKEYDIFDATDIKFLDEESIAIASKEPLTEVEKNYEKYDLDELFPVASYLKLKKHLSGLFKLCDENLGTNFYDELVALASEEAAKIKAEKAENEPKNKTEEMVERLNDKIKDDLVEAIDTNDEVTVTYKKVPQTESLENLSQNDDSGIDIDTIEEEVKPAKRERKQKVESVKSINDYFPAWEKLSDKDKNIMIETVSGIGDDNIPKYNVAKGNLYSCFDDKNCFFPGTTTETYFPADIETCPVCGKTEDSDKW